MSIEVENAVPIPPSRRLPTKYPFAKMQIGDSFLVKGTENECVAARNAAWNYASRHKVRFTSRIINGMGIRIWRTL